MPGAPQKCAGGWLLFVGNENFCKALDNLRLVRDLNGPYDALLLTGNAAPFEQARKAMKEILQERVRGILAAPSAAVLVIIQLTEEHLVEEAVPGLVLRNGRSHLRTVAFRRRVEQVCVLFLEVAPPPSSCRTVSG